MHKKDLLKFQLDLHRMSSPNSVNKNIYKNIKVPKTSEKLIKVLSRYLGSIEPHVKITLKTDIENQIHRMIESMLILKRAQLGRGIYVNGSLYTVI